MGTQRLRTSTLPALRRLARRVWSQRRIPAHVERHLRTQVRTRWHRMVSALGRLSPSRRRVARTALSGEAIVKTSQGWHVAQQTSAESAGAVAARHLDAIASALDGNGIPWFVTDPKGPARYRIGVFEEHRSEALRAIEGSALTVGPAEGPARPVATAPRVLAWANHHIGGGLVAGRELGIEVEFWLAEITGRSVPDGRTGIASFVPDPTLSDRVMVRGRPFPTYSVFRADIESTRVAFDVDVVYTWVDGTDPEWQQAYAAALVETGLLHEEAANPSRYASHDELRYSLRSLWWNADFFHRVYLVTASHRPSWLAEHPRLTVVDHAELFSADELPTFNSHAIEARLHRIEGLSEHYLYCNDDFFFGRPVEASAFFAPNGIAKFFLSTAPIPPGPAAAGDAPVDAAAKNGRDLLVGSVGYTPSRKLAHVPYPQMASVVQELEERFTDILSRTATERFRSASDVSVASSLVQHYAFATGRAVEGSLSRLYVNIADRWAPAQLAALTENRDRDVFCLNETSMAGAREDKIDRMVRKFLEEYFPTPSPFEKK
jgi:hypothetical protein